jgi:acyl-CoA thioesterase II
VRIEPYPYRARARSGALVLAESDECLLVQRDGEPAVLYFPRDAIAWSHLDEAGRDDAGGGVGATAQWTLDGRPVLRVATRPRVGLEALRDHGTFDPDRVAQEVVDAEPTTPARDITLKSFPTWGDATDLIGLLDVQPEGDGRFVGGVHSDGRRPVVEASQMLGQVIVATSRLAPARRAVSASLAAVRPADARRPLAFDLEELSAGRTFTGFESRVTQDGRVCAAGTVLLDATAPMLITHAVDPPSVPGPYECPPFDMAVTGRDLRIVDGAYSNDPDAPVGPPQIDCWVRFRHVPDDDALHAGLLAQFTGHIPIAAALRPHAGVGQDQAHRTLSMGINAIHLAIHRAVRADEWMLYHHRSTFAGDGMTHADCRVHAEDGMLLASFNVEAMVRAFPDNAERDGRTAL